jgi:predicted dehydrogenase
MAASKVRLGFVGAGFMGQLAHIRSYALLHDECELVALAEPRRETAELVAARYGIGRRYSDHREMLESEELDGVVASQPFLHHASLVPELYASVRHVFTEKPLALGADTGERLARLADDAGCVHMLGNHRRSDPATRRAKDVVDEWQASGDAGALRFLRICYPSGDWVANARAALIDAGDERPELPGEEPPPEFADEDARWALWSGANGLVHPINLLRHFLGEYRPVFAHASGRLYAFESSAGVPATLEVDPYRTTVGLEEELLVAFERGYVRLRPAPSLASNRPGSVEVYLDPDRLLPELPWIDPMRAQAEDFLRVCRGEAPPPTSAAEGAQDLKIVAELARMRLALPGGRESVRAERTERTRAWQAQQRAMEANARVT